jgi:hypothetical protein
MAGVTRQRLISGKFLRCQGIRLIGVPSTRIEILESSESLSCWGAENIFTEGSGWRSPDSRHGAGERR